jgi:ankyrin repeat protein
MLKVPEHTPIYLIFDALDECPNTTGISSSRDEVLILVEKLVQLNLPNLRLCVTSRPEADIRTVLEPLTTNRMSLHDESGQKKDIIDFVTSVVYSNKNMGRWRDEDRKLVVQTLSERASGMYGHSLYGQNRLLIILLRFRWVVCQLEVLRQCLAPSVRRILGELPETLDETYEWILHEIPKSNRVHAHRLLQCLTVAVRPLCANELAEVLAIEFDTAGGTPELNEDMRWEDQEQAVLSACSSLVAVIDDNDSRVVQFAHFSVKEFLTSDRLAMSINEASRYHHISLKPAHTIMAQVCLGVLLRLDSQTGGATIENFPLAQYAAAYFGEHAEFEDVLSYLRGGIDDLLDADKPHFAAWLHVHQGMSTFPSHSAPLYYVAGFGFRGMADHLISKYPEDLDARGDNGTPLCAALRGGHANVAQLLLGHCVDVNFRCIAAVTPLHLTVSRGLPEITRILIERHADINARDYYGRTPLHQATTGLNTEASDDNCFEVARILLEHGAHVDTQDEYYHSTPLHSASFCGSVRLAELLLQHGADVNMRNIDGQTPLHATLDGGYSDYFFDIIQLLLERGADVDTLDNRHLTPLHTISSLSGSVRAAKLLLEHGANVHIEDSEGETPVQIASSMGHEELTLLLSEHLRPRSEEGM